MRTLVSRQPPTKSIHDLLRRQMAELGIDGRSTPDPEAWGRLLERVSEAYTLADRRLVGHEREPRTEEGTGCRHGEDLGDLVRHLDHLRDARAVLEEERGSLELRVNDRTAALRHIQKRFATLHDAGIVGIAIGDAGGYILEANDCFLGMIGYDREDLDGGVVRWLELTPPELRHINEECRRELEASGVAAPRAKEYVRKDGSRIPVLVGLARLDEKTTIAIALDLTELRRSEAQRQYLLTTARNESEKLRLAEEELRRTQEQLSHSQKMEAVGQLAGGIAHDFNNILGVILGTADMAMAAVGDSDPLRADLTEIQAAGKRAADLTRQLLAFSRRQVLRPELVHLNDRIEGMTSMLRRIIGEDIELELLCGPELGLVRVDPGQIDQVLVNLVVNARDAMPTGGRLTIETANVELDEGFGASHMGVASGSHVRITVTDTGHGMDRETQSRIFEPFFTTKAKGKGTGLGLSTVFGIVQQSGGTIWVYSEPGLGTSFKVYFPRKQGVVAAASPALPAGRLRGTEVVLLAEDEDQLRTVTATILRRNGYTVLEAANAGEAILVSEQRREPIDLLLTDVVMPRMSGRQLAEYLVVSRPGMKVLFMSGYTDDTIVAHGVLNHAVPFLQKPVSVQDLLTRLRSTLDATR